MKPDLIYRGLSEGSRVVLHRNGGVETYVIPKVEVQLSEFAASRPVFYHAALARQIFYTIDGFLDGRGMWLYDEGDEERDFEACAFWGLAPGFGVLGIPTVLSECRCERALEFRCPHQWITDACFDKYRAVNRVTGKSF